MKIIFYSQDESLQAEVANFQGSDVHFVDAQEAVVELLEDVLEDEQCLLFLDFDLDYKKTLKFNDSLKDNDEWLVRIVFTSNVKLKDLKKHQKGKAAAHGYIRKPLTTDIIQGILDDFQLAEYILQNDLVNEGDSLDGAASSKSVSASATSQSEEEVEVDDASPTQMTMAKEVRDQLNAHAGGGDVPDLDSTLNLKIQEKFNLVFGAPTYSERASEPRDVTNAGIPRPGQASSDGIDSPSLDLDSSGDNDFDLDLGDDDSGYDATQSGMELPDLSAVDSTSDGTDEIQLDELSDDGTGDFDLSGDSISINEATESEDEDIELDEIEASLEAEIEQETEQEDSAEEVGFEMEPATFDDGEDFEDEPEPTMPSAVDLEMPDIGGSSSSELDASEDAVGELDLGEEESGDDFELGSDDTSDEINLDETPAQDAVESPPNNEVNMSEDKSDNEEALEFDSEDIEIEELDDGALEFGPSDSEEEESEDTGEIGFDLGGEEAEETEGAEATEEVGGFELSDDEDGELDLGVDESGETEETGGLDLGADDDDAFELDGSDESGSLDLGGDESDSLDLGADESGEISVDDTISKIVEPTGTGNISLGEGTGELDLGGEEDELDLGGEEENDQDELVGEDSGVLDLGTDADDEIGETSDVLDIGETSDILDVGETSDVLDLGDTEIEEDDTVLEDDDEIGETTNPTMVMTDTMAQEAGVGMEEFRPGSLDEEDDDDEEIDFGLEPDEEDEESEAVGEDTGLIKAPTDEDMPEEQSASDFEEDTAVTEIMEQPDITSSEEVPSAGPLFSEDKTQTNSIQVTPENERIPVGFNENELLRLQATIRQLREERDGLLTDIKELKTENKLLEQDNLGLRAELDDAKIEISIMKKRHGDEIDEMKYRNRLSEEKKMIADEKAKKLTKEFDRLQNKVRLDFSHIKQREKELESKLELVQMDSASQVSTRDKKILDLKRKIDQLEFNMENAAIKEQKSRDDKTKIEERLNKIMKTLRGSIELLEDDLELDRELLSKLDKM